MKYGFSEQQLDEIVSIIASYPEIEEAILFGSRAIDTYKEASDVDIAMKGPHADFTLAAKLKDHFEEETYLPFFFDVISYQTITSDELKAHIRDKGIVIYQKGMKKWREFISLDKIAEEITVDFHVKLKKTTLKPGDVVVVRTGKPGASTVIPKSLPESNCSDLVIIRCGEKLDPFFISYFINAINQSHIQSQLVGAVQQHFNVGSAKEIQVPDIGLKQQKAIAAVLSSLDDKIDLLHRQNKTLEAIAETLFRQWFVEEAKDEWENGVLKQYVDIGIGRTPPRKEHQWFSENPADVKWISIKDLGNDGVYIFKTKEYLTQNAVEQFNIPVIPENTVVLSFKMTVGRVAITTETMLSNEAIAHFKMRADTPFTVEYLYLFLKNFKYDLLGSTFSIVTAINSTMIKELEMTIPDKLSIQRFNKSVSKMFKKIRSNQSQIRTLEKLRDTLLPKLMSGEVQVNFYDLFPS